MNDLAKAKSKKTKKPNTREYLETALDKARELLPGWMFAVIHRAALPASGGKAKRNRRMTPAEKAFFDGKPIEGASTPELMGMFAKAEDTFKAYTRKGQPTVVVLSKAKRIVEALEARGFELVESKVVDEVKKMAPPRNLPAGTKIKKGFVNGEPEGGMHAHGLDRRNDQTFDDGPHVHLFVVPGAGDVLLTLEDGHHAHVIAEGGNSTEADGAHTHTVRMMDGTTMETKLGGEHGHDLMVETSGFGGLHRHKLKLQDGTEIESLTPGEFVERFVNMEFFHSRPIWSSRQITDAMNEVRFLRDQLFGQNDVFPSVDEAVAMMAKGEELPKPPTTLWEVVDLANGGAYCCLEDMHEPMLMKNAAGLHLDLEDVVEVNSNGEIVKHSESTVAHSFAEAEKVASYAKELEDATNDVGFTGPQDARLVFVSASPSALELARKEALIGPDGVLFLERYLAPLGLKKSDVAAGFAIPVHCEPTEADIELWKARLHESLKVYNGAKVIALGRVAKQALGTLMDFSLPHPAAVRRHGDSGEVDRKIRSVSKALDIGVIPPKTLKSSSSDPSHGKPGTNLADSTSEPSNGEDLSVPVRKSLEEKQIVFGVILDPYQVDLHNDWLPPAEIESTAHDFLTKSRIVGLQHKGVAEAEVVESWIEAYPTPEDRELALQNLPHRAYQRKFGSDIVHSGAWIAGVKLSDELWAAFRKGDLDAFSIGGFSFKTQISSDAMPDVEFVELTPNS